jgi:hypothetical protein
MDRKGDSFMNTTRIIGLIAGLAIVASQFVNAESFRTSPARVEAIAPPNSWYFVVSGDSRDCGDLIMPKIAASVAAKRQQLPIKFYWHLGDFRALYRIDCDMALRMDLSFQCVQGNASPSETAALKQQYLKAAWPDFIEREVKPFEQAGVPIYLGIGNHETIGRTHDQFLQTFKKWLTLPAIKAQRKADAKKHIFSKDGESYFHFVMNGVDFIYLDNADRNVGFSTEQLNWLSLVLKADAADDSVKTIIAGMHEALPFSVSSNHAMDETCPGVCSGSKAYDLLEQAQNLNGPAAKQKHVYVLASHSHFFEEEIYNTPKHKDHVLPGWIIGTGGAEQYKPTIRYGYVLVEVKTDGTIATSFVDVDRNSPPLLTGEYGDKLTSYCFEQNKKPPISQAAQNCHCTLN